MVNMKNIEVIKSRENKKVKEIIKLNDKKYRKKYQKYYIEGIKLVKEAFKYNDFNILEIFISEKVKSEEKISEIISMATKKDIKIIYTTHDIIEKISEQKNAEGVIAIINIPQNISKEEITEKNFTILENISDPGNLGTILRTYSALGIKEIGITKESVDPFSPKVLRASMGAIFKIKIHIIEDILETLDYFEKEGYNVYLTDMDGENIYKKEFKKEEKNIIIFGNEANGISSKLKNKFKNKLKIPMKDTTESLNISISASVIAYEMYRKGEYN